MTTTRAPSLLAAAATLLAACSGPSHSTMRWTGTSTPTAQGVTCVKSRAVAQVRDGLVIFAPDDGTWTLTGNANPDGTISAERSQPGVDKKLYLTQFEAKWSPETITGTYTTPRCTFAVNLTRT